MENVNNECDTHGSLEDNKHEKEIIKCPECLCVCSQNELDTFGGLCEECSGAFDD